MMINRLRLNGFRGIREMELEFSEHVNVLVGVNGAGKSSVLDAIAILLSWFPARIRHSSGSGRKIKGLDINNKVSLANLAVDAHIDTEDVVWSLVKIKKGRIGREIKSNLAALNQTAKYFQQRIEQAEAPHTLPLLVYYPVNRSVIDIPLRISRKHEFEILETYDNALTSGSNFRIFFEWFRNREDLENENRKYLNAFFKPDDWQFPDPQLETVRQAFGWFLPGFNGVTVRRNPLRMTVNKNNEELRIDQLSDGEKCLMAMVGDLARRLAIANPNVENALNGRGIVLIDEIDLHLHPAWQRMIISNLHKTFPNCQFIVSTHSPQIISHVDAESLFLLSQTSDGIKYSRTNESYGKNTDRILEDLMGVDARPQEIKTELRELYKTIERGELDLARSTVANMKEKIGDDPELTKAGVLIRRKELIGK
jgi:predicted ATP-binding protein involved in virulence